jgi:hypothetical protein
MITLKIINFRDLLINVLVPACEVLSEEIQRTLGYVDPLKENDFHLNYQRRDVTSLSMLYRNFQFLVLINCMIILIAAIGCVSEQGCS